MDKITKWAVVKHIFSLLYCIKILHKKRDCLPFLSASGTWFINTILTIHLMHLLHCQHIKQGHVICVVIVVVWSGHMRVGLSEWLASVVCYCLQAGGRAAGSRSTGWLGGWGGALGAVIMKHKSWSSDVRALCFVTSFVLAGRRQSRRLITGRNLLRLHSLH